jgi:hypothetical protein
MPAYVRAYSALIVLSGRFSIFPVGISILIWLIVISIEVYRAYVLLS